MFPCSRFARVATLPVVLRRALCLCFFMTCLPGHVCADDAGVEAGPAGEGVAAEDRLDLRALYHHVDSVRPQILFTIHELRLQGRERVARCLDGLLSNLHGLRDLVVMRDRRWRQAPDDRERRSHERALRSLAYQLHVLIAEVSVCHPAPLVQMPWRVVGGHRS